MKTLNLLLATALLGIALPTHATLFTQGTGVGSGTAVGTLANATIADGSPIGTVNQMDLSTQGLGSISGLTVTLNLSGGYNGDLYGYLSYNGTMVVLLNRIGVSSGTPFGNNTSGLTVTLSDAGTANIHNPVNGLTSQTYNVDNNQNVSPFAGAGSFTSSSSGSLSAFTGNPNGTWTLFLADMVGGGGPTTLLGWGLDITAVPEPSTWALLIFGSVAGVTVVARRLRRATV